MLNISYSKLKPISNNQIDFSLKDISKEEKDLIKKYHDYFSYTKGFKIRNNTGIFETHIYFDNYCRVAMKTLIASKKVFLVTNDTFYIDPDGKIYCYFYKYGRQKTKTNTGLIIDKKTAAEITDFILKMKEFSKILREKH